MSNNRYKLVCAECGKELDEKKYNTRCPSCDDVLDIQYDYEEVGKRLNKYDLQNAPISAEKYLDLLPINDFGHVVSLQEGGTHLYKTERVGAEYGLNNLYVKNEGLNPTGVFKDRGTFVEITKAKETGAKSLIIASSGNMAASCTAYASKAGLNIYVLVPEDTPVGKLSQILSYGAHVLKIKGDYSTCVKLVDQVAKEHKLYQVGDYVFRREGQKTLAYELIEQMSMSVPDYVIVPSGAGTHIAAIWKGFKEYQKLGIVKKLPKLVAVQPKGCAVLVEAFNKKKKRYKKWSKSDTLCSAVAVTDPTDGNLALKALHESKGMAVSVKDEDALKAQKLLASTEGIFAEPSSALSIAALELLIKKKVIKKNSSVVCVATGHGLKDPMSALTNMKMPKTFDADFKQISRYFKAVHK